MNQSMKFVLRVIKQIDFFTQPVQLMIKKEKGHKTLYGAIITIGLLFIIFTEFINNLILLFEGANGQIIGYQQQKFEPNLVYLDSQNFSFQIGIQNAEYKTYIDESIWIMKMKSYSKKYLNGEEVWMSDDIPMTICSPNAIYQENQREDFSHVDQTTNYCIDWAKIQQIPLQGQFIAQQFSYIGVDFYMCSNQTKKQNGPECKSRGEILSALQHNYLSIQMSTVIPDLSQTKNPFIEQVANYYTTISGKLFKEVTFYMQSQTIYTEDGIFLDNLRVEKALSFLRSTELLDLNDDSDTFLHLTIRLDLVESITKRTYQKMSAVLSQIGGLWNVLYTLALILQYPISNLSYKLAIINSLFNFQGQQVVTNRKVSLEFQTQSNQLDNFPQSNSTGRINRTTTHSDYVKKKLKSILIKSEKMEQMKNLFEKEKLSKHLVQSVQNFFNTVRRKMKLSFSEYITLFNYSDQKFKKKQFDFSVKKLEESLDILYILQKIHEIDKLKMLLLTPAQLKVFDYLPKPTIAENPERPQQRYQYFTILQSHKSNFQKAAEAQQAFKEIANNLDDPLNKQLISFMDENILELLKLQFQQENKIEQKDLEQVSQKDEQEKQENVQQQINQYGDINVEINSGQRQFIYKSIIN